MAPKSCPHCGREIGPACHDAEIEMFTVDPKGFAELRALAIADMHNVGVKIRELPKGPFNQFNRPLVWQELHERLNGRRVTFWKDGKSAPRFFGSEGEIGGMRALTSWIRKRFA